MEFKDLSSDIQRIAAHTLAEALKDLGTEIKIEPAKELARGISESFVELYKDNSSPLCCTNISVQESHKHAAKMIACASAHTIRHMGK